jgi:hypothetical protein
MPTSTVFVAYTSADKTSLREDLIFTLRKAGMQVLPETLQPNSDEAALKAEIKSAIAAADCSIHLIGNEKARSLNSENNTGLDEWQFDLCRNKLSDARGFKLFVWHPVSHQSSVHSHQSDFIERLQYSIEANMTYTNTPSAIQLTDDLRSMLQVIEKPQMQLNQTDIFFISNMLDEPSAEEIADMLSDVTQIEKVMIEQDSDEDYAELTSQQVPKSKLAVVYFKDSADWAIPFAQQIWKKVGGASATTPILVIGDEDPDTNKSKVFKAPKVVSMVIAGELIPLEIKVQFDKAVEA